MNRFLIPLVSIVSAGLLVGCQSGQQQQAAEWDNNARRDTNAWMMHTYFDSQIANGVVRQHTLFTHHFVDGTASLTELGERDIEILAEHYAEHGGGVLVMSRGGMENELYDQRLAVVRVGLAKGGVEPALVAIDDGVWTGDSARSTRAAADVVRPSDDDPYNFHVGESGKK